FGHGVSVVSHGRTTFRTALTRCPRFATGQAEDSSRRPPWPVGEDEATRLALPHLGWGGGVRCACASPNRNVGAPTARTSWAVVVHRLTILHIVACWSDGVGPQAPARSMQPVFYLMRQKPCASIPSGTLNLLRKFSSATAAVSSTTWASS